MVGVLVQLCIAAFFCMQTALKVQGAVNNACLTDAAKKMLSGCVQCHQGAGSNVGSAGGSARRSLRAGRNEDMEHIALLTTNLAIRFVFLVSSHLNNSSLVPHGWSSNPLVGRGWPANPKLGQCTLLDVTLLEERASPNTLLGTPHDPSKGLLQSIGITLKFAHVVQSK